MLTVHISKLEQDREDWHGPWARMTCKFIKRPIFFHWGTWCHQVLGCWQGPCLDFWTYCSRGHVDVLGLCYYQEFRGVLGLGLPQVANSVTKGHTTTGNLQSDSPGLSPGPWSQVSLICSQGPCVGPTVARDCVDIYSACYHRGLWGCPGLGPLCGIGEFSWDPRGILQLGWWQFEKPVLPSGALMTSKPRLLMRTMYGSVVLSQPGSMLMSITKGTWMPRV